MAPGIDASPGAATTRAKRQALKDHRKDLDRLISIVKSNDLQAVAATPPKAAIPAPAPLVMYEQNFQFVRASPVSSSPRRAAHADTLVPVSVEPRVEHSVVHDACEKNDSLPPPPPPNFKSSGINVRKDTAGIGKVCSALHYDCANTFMFIFNGFREGESGDAWVIRHRSCGYRDLENGSHISLIRDVPNSPPVILTRSGALFEISDFPNPSSDGTVLGKVERHVVRLSGGADPTFTSMAVTAQGDVLVVDSSGRVLTCPASAIQRVKGFVSSTVEMTPIQGRLRYNNVSHVCCGGGFTLALTSIGQVYSWGDSEYGALGHGGDVTRVTGPCVIAELQSNIITMLDCGEDHCVALDELRDVYTWGRGDHGRLGHGDVADKPTPCVVDVLSNRETQPGVVTMVAAGSAHCALLRSAGQVMTWGCNDSGQLGLGDYTDRLLPKAVTMLFGHLIVSLSCGPRHCAATDGWHVFVWGANSGVSGVSGASTRPVLFESNKPCVVEAVYGIDILSVVCGVGRTFLLTRAGMDASDVAGGGHIVNDAVKDAAWRVWRPKQTVIEESLVLRRRLTMLKAHLESVIVAKHAMSDTLEECQLKLKRCDCDIAELDARCLQLEGSVAEQSSKKLQYVDDLYNNDVEKLRRRRDELERAVADHKLVYGKLESAKQSELFELDKCRKHYQEAVYAVQQNEAKLDELRRVQAEIVEKGREKAALMDLILLHQTEFEQLKNQNRQGLESELERVQASVQATVDTFEQRMRATVMLQTKLEHTNQALKQEISGIHDNLVSMEQAAQRVGEGRDEVEAECKAATAMVAALQDGWEEGQMTKIEMEGKVQKQEMMLRNVQQSVVFRAQSRVAELEAALHTLTTAREGDANEALIAALRQRITYLSTHYIMSQPSVAESEGSPGVSRLQSVSERRSSSPVVAALLRGVERRVSALNLI